MYSASSQPEIAIIIPCFNESVSIAHVIGAFRASLPAATIYVFDNGSTDETSSIAQQAGARVRLVPHIGKGNVVRCMFADIAADFYLMVDGDNTYDASSAPAMIDLMTGQQLDMVVGVRVATHGDAYRAGHRLGNRLFSGLVKLVFGNQFTDILSGYRVFSKRFVKSFPAQSSGFEIETELTIHALEMRLRCAELKVGYSERGLGSVSKLRTYSDGARILGTIVQLIREKRPFAFFSSCAMLLLIFSLALGVPVILEFMTTGLVPRLPTAILATGLMLLANLSFFTGLMLDSIRLGRLEAKHLAYLSYSPFEPHDSNTANQF